MDKGTPVLLTAPDAELEALSFAVAEPAAVAEWISRLPMANVADSAGQIRQATFEIARLKTTWQARLDLLEGIRPTVAYLAARLDRTALQGGTHTDTVARLAQRLESNACSGYCAVILGALDAAATDPAGRAAVSLATHRSLLDLAHILLRSLQFYIAPTDDLWLKLNQLYLLAERLDLQHDRHPDTESNAELCSSISETYLRAALLALARPYQLRHKQLSQVDQALAAWTGMTALTPAHGDDLYLIDLASDKGPALAERRERVESLRAIHTEKLVAELDAYLREAGTAIAVPTTMDEGLLRHLLDAWHGKRTRAFGRSKTESPVQICVGMVNAHYFLSGGVEFAELLRSSEADRGGRNPFVPTDPVYLSKDNMKRTHDVWDSAFDASDSNLHDARFETPDLIPYDWKPKPAQTGSTAPAEPAGSYRAFDVMTVDTSPSGYQLRWSEPIPASLQTGELIALRDQADTAWCLAIARWIRQDAKGAFMGVELVAPKVKPVAVRVMQSHGRRATFQRGLLAPALELIDQPATLITTTMTLQPGQKIQCWDAQMHTTAQLTECVLKTESVNQFTFRVLAGYLENASPPTNMVNAAPHRKHRQTGSG